jgi:CDP-diacylglycerol--glycerol-3-phosphate 3-phosphatidyltransferase
MNLPNKITVGRMFGTLLFVAIATLAQTETLTWLGLEPGSQELYLTWKILRVIGYVLMAACGFSDILDGYVARKYNLITDFGKLMDPLSDKIYVMVGFLWMAVEGMMHPAIVALILAREFAVTGLRGLAAKKGQVIAAKSVGKLKAIFQMSILGFGGLFWADILPYEPESHEIYKLVLVYFWDALLAFMVIFTVYTGIDYFWKARDLYMKDT